MELFRMFTQISVVGKLSLLITMLPLAAGMGYLLRPTEQRLAVMRPISLAGIFSGLSGAMLGLMNTLRWYSMKEPPPTALAIGVAESLVSLFVAFGCLTAAWLCVAVGMRRNP